MTSLEERISAGFCCDIQSLVFLGDYFLTRLAQAAPFCTIFSQILSRLWQVGFEENFNEFSHIEFDFYMSRVSLGFTALKTV
jgi:hypothetical protein